MKNILYFLVILLTVGSSCRKDINETVTTNNIPEPKVFVRTAVQGKVIDQNQSPIAFENVQIGDNLATTDAQGKFSFEEVTVEKNGNLIKATANGFFSGGAHSTFSAEGSSYTQITLLAKEDPVEMNALDGKTFTDDSNLKITIPANALRNSDGSPYSGMANIYSKYIDPSDANLGTNMPSALTTIQDGALQAIETFGMMTVGIDAVNGEVLEVDPNLGLDMEIPIPSDLVDLAPSEIPLWYFDLEEEQWYLAGTCTLSDNVYLCSVIGSGAGYYCTGIANTSICLSGTIINNDLTPAFYMKVLVENLTDNFVYWGYTDINGAFCGSVPKDVELQISIIDHCNTTVYSETIGPFSVDTELPSIQLSETIETFVINLKGQINECMIEPLSFGHVAITRPGKITVQPWDSGLMDVNFAMNCVEFPELEIRVYSGIQFETMSALFIHDEYTDLDIGEVFMCTEIDDFFNVTYGGQETVTMPTQWYWEENATTDHILLEGFGRSGKFILEILEYNGVGTYENGVLFHVENDDNFPFFSTIVDTISGLTLEITSDDGTYIEGNFEGMVFDQITSNQSFASSEFRIKKRP